jgi:hypothetical protein
LQLAQDHQAGDSVREVREAGFRVGIFATRKGEQVPKCRPDVATPGRALR